MTAQAISVPRPEAGSGDGPRGGGFGSLLRAEWIKFRSVRGWVIGMILAALLTIFLGVFAASNASIGCQINGGPLKSGKACLPPVPHGPGGEVVTDSFSFARQPLTGNGTITAEVTSLTGEHANLGSGPVQVGGGNMVPGLVEWAKAGIIIKQSTHQGSAYAAMMVTGGHGARMQDNFTGDTAGMPGAVAAADPLRRHDHRLRLRRRHALDPGGHGPAGRAAVDRPGRHVRYLTGLYRDPELVRRRQQ
jgi:hypothetical protein